MTSLCPDVDIDRKILRPRVRVDRKFSHPVRILCWNWPYKIIFVLNPYPDVYCDRKILHLGVGAQMLTSIVNFPYIQGAYIQGFLQSGVLQSGVLTIRGSYNQGFLQSGVLTIRGLHQCILHDTSVPSYWYWSLLLTFSGSNERVLHDRSVGFLYSGVLTIRGSYNQGFKWTCITWQVCAQMLILIVKSYDQGSVLIVNFYI